MHLKRSDFIYDKSINVWYPSSGVKNFDYKDGAENNLYKKITACIDKSIYSEELLPYRDWPEEYHLSPLRCNLLIGIQDFIGAKKRILELGCGCGSITRYLGEQGHDVIAVEGSIDRARVAGARCNDLSNVKIFCSDFQHIDFTDEQFDIITLIGVFEYSALYWKSEAPYKKCLEFINKHRCEKTLVILAIENQLGMKYLNGMREDHVGREYYGINDLYQTEDITPQTFTRESLSQLIKETLNLKYIEFLGLFPDYKLPTLMLTEEAFDNEQLKAYQIISTVKSRDYSSMHVPLFHEASLFKVLQREGIGFSFANSFLVLISNEEREKIDWLAKIISNNRKVHYNTETTIRNFEDSLCVEKRRLSEIQVENPVFSFDIALYSEFHSGELLSFEFERMLFFARDKCWNILKKSIIEWALFLKKNCKEHSTMIDGEWYDAIPRNIMRVGENLIYFDREWKLKKPINVQVVIIRGIIDTFFSVDRSIWILKIPHKNLKSLICEICSAIDMPINNQLFKEAWSINTMLYSSASPGIDFNDSYKRKKRETIESLLFQRLILLFIDKFKKLLPWGIRKVRKFKYFIRVVQNGIRGQRRGKAIKLIG
jgi:SAM-dependent methyltransferase